MGILNGIDTSQCEYEASVQLTSNLKDDIIRQLDLSSPSYANNKALKDLKYKKNAFNKTKERWKSWENKWHYINWKQTTLQDVVYPYGSQLCHWKKKTMCWTNRSFSTAYIWDTCGKWRTSQASVHVIRNLHWNIHYSVILVDTSFRRHNNLRDLGANLIREISHDVRVEQPLLEVSPQETTDLPKSAIKGDETRGADFSANGFWRRYQRAFFDVKVCNLLAPSYRSKLLVNTLSSMERDKKPEI